MAEFPRALMTADGPLLPPPRLHTPRLLETEAGTIHTALGDNNRWYMSQEELKSAVARMEGKDPEVVWSMYRRTTGDEYCRKLQRLMEEQLGLGVNQHIQFTDSQGTKWMVGPFALHFVAQHHGILEAQIYEHFCKTTLVDATMRDPASTPGPVTAVQRHLAAALSLLDSDLQTFKQDVSEHLSTVREQVHEVAATASEALTQVSRVRHSQRQTLYDYAREHGYLTRFGHEWLRDCATHLVGVHRLQGADVIKIGVIGQPYERVNGYFVDIMDEAVPRWLGQRFTQGHL